MQTKFTPSVNIIRDQDNNLNYIPTSNSIYIFNQIKNNFQAGIHAFNIIGTYGSGKSSFILAFEKNLTGKKKYFETLNGQFNNLKKFEFINIIGQYKSIYQSFADYLKIKKRNEDNETILSKIKSKYDHLSVKNTGLVIVIDEFGKFLEYAAKNEPEKELFFIQQLAEYANDPQNSIILITVLHQSFEAYARNLDNIQKHEWEKVKGRLKDLTFNEPVEQLLVLAAEYLSQKKYYNNQNIDFKKINKIIENSNTFSLRNEITEDFARNLFPLDLLSASVLTLSLQTYGQNERSLFTFLESRDPLGINEFIKTNNSFYSLPDVYDYLHHNYYSYLLTRNNPHYIQWSAIRNSLERVESVIETEYENAKKIVKSIGLLSIFASEAAKINSYFLQQYSQKCLNIKDISTILEQLENKKIIRHINFKDRYILFEGTDLDIELSLKEAAEKIDPIKNIAVSLNHYFDFPYIPAKSVSYNWGTPRYFEFIISDSPVSTKPTGEIDGIINLVFGKEIDIMELMKYHSIKNPAILYGVYKNSDKILESLTEIEKIKYVLKHVADDIIAERELRNILNHHIQELNKNVLNDLYTDNINIEWIHNNKIVEFLTGSTFNNYLSEICSKNYSSTPIYKNELINRHKTPAVITTARKNFFNALITNWEEKDLGFTSDKFPPEKTIYLSLLKKPGMHRIDAGTWGLNEVTDPSFSSLWQASESFLKSSLVIKQNLQEFFDLLSKAPFKLKNGFLEFWIPLFLFVKREEYALFGDNGFIPNLDVSIIELLLKHPRKFQIKAFNIEGVKLDLFNKYRSLINKESAQCLSTSSFIDTIKPFLIFYKNLPEYAKRTKRLSKSAISLRTAIENATDPEKTFFEDFPHALGYVDLNLRESPKVLSDYIFQLQTNIKEIRTCFDELINRIENYLLKETGLEEYNFPAYKTKLNERYSTLKIPLLLNHQKVFYFRIVSDLDDRKSWISSIVQSVLEKSINEMRDEEEEFVYEKISDYIHELDGLCDISKLEFDRDREEILKFEITDLDKGLKSHIVRLPKTKVSQMNELKQKISSLLTKDKSLNFAALTKLLEELQNGKN